MSQEPYEVDYEEQTHDGTWVRKTDSLHYKGKGKQDAVEKLWAKRKQGTGKRVRIIRSRWMG